MNKKQKDILAPLNVLEIVDYLRKEKKLNKYNESDVISYIQNR